MPMGGIAASLLSSPNERVYRYSVVWQRET